MADRNALEAAAEAGVITPEQVTPLHDFLAARAQPVAAAPNGEEDLRFIRNFHDVFLAIGIVLFAVGMAIGIGTAVGEGKMAGATSVLLGGLLTGAAAVMWILGEVFARRRRLFLPAIAIICAFTLFSAFAAACLYFGVVTGRETTLDIDTLHGAPPVVRNGVLLAVLFLTIAPLAFYLRFRLPFSIGMVGAGLATFVTVVALFANWDATVANLPALMLVMGLSLFAAGVAFDARDPARATRLSDNGFWLHFTAAPLILNGAFGLVGRLFSGPSTTPTVAMMAHGDAAAAQAGATLLVVLLLGLVSLLINRRALIVSALLTTGIAIAALMNAVGLGAGALAASTLIVLGAFVLVLGASWHGARRFLLERVKPDGVWARIFPPETPATA